VRRDVGRLALGGFAVAVVVLGVGAGCSKAAPASASGPSSTPGPASEAVGASLPADGSRSSTSKARRTGPPELCNVILLSIDSLRADMPWNGYPRPIAPRLTELESKSVSFTRAYSVSSYTSMSLGGLLAGRVPSELERSGYFFGTYRHDVFFPKLLQKAGVHTMGVMAHGYLKTAGFEQGFDEWRIVPGITFDPNTDHNVTSPGSERLAEELLGEPENDSRRFFFWAHFLDPHDQYMHHPGIDWGKKPRDLYDGEVTFTDSYIGKLLDFVATRSWAERTIIVITSDHGEEFGEHRMARHGFEVWDTLVHVPLFFFAPGAEPRRIGSVRSALDLAPTFLDLFGVSWDGPLEGKSLVTEIYGASSEDRDVVVDLPETSDSGRRRALVHGSEKLICFEGNSYCKLFDLRDDPMEQSPILKGLDYKAMKERYDAASRAIHEVTPYACNVDCLNSAYRKKETN
jgi:choline-sulfatase